MIEYKRGILIAAMFYVVVYLFGERLSTHENWLYLGDRVIYTLESMYYS